jgi:hypothetical protein
MRSHAMASTKRRAERKTAVFASWRPDPGLALESDLAS